ncbi:hypothetical protein ACJZ2D_002161 [Fusarium nematophilum]
MATSQHGQRPIRIASISAYSGDRLNSLESVLSGPIHVDAIIGDYLAEMNLSWRKAEMTRDASKGYDPTFLQSLRVASKQLRNRLDTGTFPKLVVNAGAMHPGQLAQETCEFLASEFGDRGKELKVAYITGDDVLNIIQDQQAQKHIKHLTTGETLDKWPYEPVIANAYIGQFGFVAALTAGADIVLAGRATDASSTQALATWWFGWSPEDYDNHAMGLIVGHIIECGNYVTGGNFCGFKRIPQYYDLAYPITEIFNDGHCVVTKQPGQNGLVDIDTVRSQLMYEIQGRYYYNPDVVADLSHLEVTQEAPDRVHIRGFKGLPPPGTLKVAIQAYAGYQAEILVYAIGLDIEEKARSFETQVRRELSPQGGSSKKLRRLEVQLFGSSAPNPRSSNAATAVIRVFAQTEDEELLTRSRFEYPVIQHLGEAFPGFTPNLEYTRTSQPRPFLSYFPALINRSHVDMEVHWVNSEDTIKVSHSTSSISKPEDVRQENYEPRDPVELDAFGPTVQVPLGHKLLGDDAQAVSRVERVEFPKIKCVHFVLFDLLGGGVTDTSRPDSLGKGLAEFVRARIVGYPAKLYTGMVI